MNNINYDQYLVPCRDIARGAGELIMQYFTAGFETSRKQDSSPVTDADIAANRFITEALAKLAPHIPAVAEEDEVINDAGHARFWLVDPLDGTRSFIRGEPEFTVNIGLIENGAPKLGVIYVPPLKRMYFASEGRGAFRLDDGKEPQRLHARKPADDGLVVVKSKSHPSPATTAYLETINVKEMRPGSSSVKFCLIAEGSADIYPRFGRTMEWDTAAGHTILNEAGGRVETVDGKTLAYGKPGFENPHFIAYGR